MSCQKQHRFQRSRMEIMGDRGREGVKRGMGVEVEAGGYPPFSGPG